MGCKSTISLSLNAYKKAYKTAHNRGECHLKFFTRNSVHNHSAKQKVKHQVVLVPKCESGRGM